MPLFPVVVVPPRESRNPFTQEEEDEDEQVVPLDYTLLSDDMYLEASSSRLFN